MVILAAIAISIPSLFNELIEPNFQRVETLSLTTAVVVLGIYVLSIIYALRQPQNNNARHIDRAEPRRPAPGAPAARCSSWAWLSPAWLSCPSSSSVRWRR